MSEPRRVTSHPIAHSPWLAAGVLTAVAIAAYANSLSTPFVFDDWAAIVENPTIRDWRAWSDVLTPPPNTGVTGRPLINATLAFNYALGGLNPMGYHAFNLTVHLLSGLVLCGLLRKTFLQPILRARFGTLAAPLSLGVATLWIAHPLLTESVTCVVQRTEVVTGFFYLMTIYAFVRGAKSKRPRRWNGLAIGACALGMVSKEVMVTAPLIVLLYDRTFIAGTTREAWCRRRSLYLGLAGTWLLLACLVAGEPQRSGTVGFNLGVTPFEYLLTQCRALTVYLRLVFWPHPLIVDYGTEVARQIAEVLPQAAFMLLLLGATGFALVRRSAAGFVGAFFFLVLAPSSSVLPLTTQTIAEHRMYLPLAAVLTLASATFYDRFSRGGIFLFVPVALCFVGLTIRRNYDYRSELALWESTVGECPDQARPQNNLGFALFQAGRTAEAKTRYEAAVHLDPRYSPAQNNLGDALVALGRAREALPHYEEALQISPADARMHFNLANALAQLDRAADAIPHYEEALRLSPGDANKHHRLGIVLFRMGRVEDAIMQYEHALQLRPDYPEVRNNLGTALLALGRVDEARAQFERALQLHPNYERARANLLRLDTLEESRKSGR